MTGRETCRLHLRQQYDQIGLNREENTERTASARLRLKGTSNAPRQSFGSKEKMERVKRFERSTPTLARLCSTPELHPLINPGPGVVGGPWRPR